MLHFCILLYITFPFLALFFPLTVVRFAYCSVDWFIILISVIFFCVPKELVALLLSTGGLTSRLF